jgi:hypothetical protein
MADNESDLQAAKKNCEILFAAAVQEIYKQLVLRVLPNQYQDTLLS